MSLSGFASHTYDASISASIWSISTRKITCEQAQAQGTKHRYRHGHKHKHRQAQAQAPAQARAQAQAQAQASWKLGARDKNELLLLVEFCALFHEECAARSRWTAKSSNPVTHVHTLLSQIFANTKFEGRYFTFHLKALLMAPFVLLLQSSFSCTRNPKVWPLKWMLLIRTF